MHFVVFWLFLVTLSAFGSGFLLSTEETQYLQDNPEINFVSQTNYPPFEFVDDNGDRQGMCIELVRWMATEMGFQARFTDMSFQEAQDAVLSGEADVITSFFYSDIRDLSFDFTRPIFEIPARIFIGRDTKGISCLEHLNGKRIAVQFGDYAIGFLEAESIQCSLVYVDSFTDGVHSVLDGKADALIGDEQIVEFHLFEHHSPGEMISVGDTLYVGLNCMSVVQEDSLLCSIIDKGIKYAFEQGIVNGISTKWYGNPLRLHEKGIEKYFAWFVAAIGVLFAIAVLVSIWNMRLRQLVEQKTLSIQKSRERLDQALDQANLGSWEYDLSTGCAKNNDRNSMMLGYSPGERNFSIKEWIKLVHPDDRELLKSSIEQLLSNDNVQYKTEYRMKTREGKWIWIHSCGGVSERDGNGKALRIAGVHQDISLRKHSDELVRGAVSDWKSTFDAVPEMIAVFNSEGSVLRVNRSQSVAVGLTRKECRGRKISELMYSTDSAYVSGIESLLAGERKNLALREVSFRELDGLFDVSIAVMTHPGGDGIRGIQVARDISERKLSEKNRIEMERKIQHSQKLESLGVLAGGIAHDFNNILMAISGYTDLAFASINEDAPVSRHLAEIRKTVGIASELSGQMLSYSGRGNFVVETVFLGEVIEVMRPMLNVSVSRKAILTISVAENLPAVRVDITQMQQVILNLITNASEAIGSSTGEISVTVGFEEALPPGEISEIGTRSYVYIQVDDTGCGMSPATVEKLFEPFFSTKFTGRGLGMAVVHGIVYGHMGFISVNSSPGEGSSFKIFIPAVGDVNSELSRSTEEKSFTSCSKTAGILVVDDEPSILSIGREILESNGYTVFSAEDGEEAVKIYRESREEISCVILDLTMPRMDGVECFRMLREIDPDVRVVLSSGYNMQDAESRIHLDELAGYLKKPYSLAELLQLVGKVVSTS